MKNAIVFLLFCLSATTILSCKQQAALNPAYLRVEYKENPVIDAEKPRFSWLLESKSPEQSQTAYQIIVATSPGLLSNEKADVWNSGIISSPSTHQVEYQGTKLESKKTYYWKVRSWDKNGNMGKWSKQASWKMGLLNQNEWQAEWIGYDLTHLGKGKVNHLPPAPYLRKEINVTNKVKKATLFVSALGLYEFYINGEKAGDEWLTPGWTNYNKRLHYQVFDVSKQIKTGENALGATLSYGWYAGYVGYAQLIKHPKQKAFYGDVPKLIARLELEYADGSIGVFVTDSKWKAAQGPLLETDILHGETYDANLEQTGWYKIGFNDNEWDNVQVFDDPGMKLSVHPGEPVRVTEKILPVKITNRPDSKYIIDMGQNFAGLISFKFKGEKGQKIVIKYGEMLHPDGRLMTENLRSARVTDTYIMKGDKNGEEWTPQFTFHGFQYFEIDGLDYTPSLNDFTGLAIGSETPIGGSFECSNPMINKLYSNIVWTQRANFLEIPTDCPQRDERLGWTGDAQIYISSAIRNMDVAAFFTKWMIDLNDEQWPDGTYPNFAPKPYNRYNFTYSPGWMEAGIICPYQIFKDYGDTRMVSKYWENMEKFMEFHVNKAGENFIHKEATFEEIYPKGGFSDWLSVGTKTAPELISTLYFGYCAKMMAEMAEAIGLNDRAEYYKQMFDNVKSGFNSHYVDEQQRFICNAEAYGDGKGYVDGIRGFTGHTQTAYANALYMGFFDQNSEKIYGQHLANLVLENDSKLTTGFLGVKQLLPALSQTGRTDLAYTLLLNTEYPSWGFAIENGATSIWERWNSYTHEHGFPEGMNSFSHYAFGSVYEWMFENMAGIKNTGIAFNNFVLKPEIDPRIDFVKATYKSMNGQISSYWKKEGEKLIYEVEVPVNSEATIILPLNNYKNVLAVGKNQEIGAKAITIDNGTNEVLIPLKSGKYKFELFTK